MAQWVEYSVPLLQCNSEKIQVNKLYVDVKEITAPSVVQFKYRHLKYLTSGVVGRLITINSRFEYTRCLTVFEPCTVLAEHVKVVCKCTCVDQFHLFLVL